MSDLPPNGNDDAGTDAAKPTPEDRPPDSAAAAPRPAGQQPNGPVEPSLPAGPSPAATPQEPTPDVRPPSLADADESPGDQAPATASAGSSESTDAPSAPPRERRVGYGAALRAARERMNVRPKDIAASLHLGESVVRAIETGAEDELPARVYVRGYIRAYANLVGLDADELAADFDAAGGAEPEIEAKPVIGVSRRSLSDLPQRRAGLLFSGIVVVIVIALACALWAIWNAFDWSFAGDAEGLPTPAWRTQRAQPADTVAAAPEVVSAATPIAGGDGAADAKPAAPAPLDDRSELVFVFKEKSWVKVVDSQNNVLHEDVGAAGDAVSVFGQVPFTIEIGYAAGVELRHDGEAVALAPHTRGNVAHLVVH